MSEWYNGIYKGFIMASVIAFIIGFFSQGEVSLGSYISGYSVLILAIIMILIILINNITNMTPGQSTSTLIFSILMTSIGFADESQEVAQEVPVTKKLILEGQTEGEAEISQEEVKEVEA